MMVFSIYYSAWLQTTQQCQFVLFIIDRIKEGQDIYKIYKIKRSSQSHKLFPDQLGDTEAVRPL